jgi:flagellar motor switch protein FliM
MKPENDFVAERAAASHCPELFRRGPTPADMLSQFAIAGERMARLLADRFAPIKGGHAPSMHCLPIQECDAAALRGMIAPLAGNCLLSTDGGIPLLVSFQAEGVFHLLDCSFGGPGEVPSPLPDAFPYSAELMMHRLEATAASSLTTALGMEVNAKARSERLGEISAFPKDTPLAVLPLETKQSGGLRWTVTIATPLAALETLFDRGECTPPRRVGQRHPATEPFGGLPLTLSAVLVDMRMAVSALSELRPGQILPVSVARSVPLRVGETTIGHGTVGALDDRVALQLTQAF